jgi:RHS repeat-associated protein
LPEWGRISSPISTRTYDSFGNLVTSSGSIVNNFRYTGREWDAETGLYYYRARYYDQQSGRFLREDPLGFAVGQNHSLYVSNNPVKRKDPLGLWQANIGGGEGLGGMLSLGYNSGQWNFAFYTGLGEGVFIDYDPMDSGGCHKYPGGGETRAHGGISFGPDVSFDVDDTIPWEGRPNLDVSINVPGGRRYYLESR